ncbi:MAG: T9SS type A sorting domain-containing protein [Bacteroidales bacterium]
MKAIIKFIVLFIFLSDNSSFCQSNYHFVDSTKKWNTLHFGLGSFLNPCNTHTTITHFNGDTIINGLKYSKVWESDDSLQQNWELYGFIREDTTTHEVFYLNHLSEEGKIYDFGIELYDTVSIFNTYIYSLPYPVLITCYLIDSVLINDEFRLRYYLGFSFSNNQYSNVDTWIEGIGSVDGIFASAIHGSGFSGGYFKLLCYSENDYVLYVNPKFHTCYTNTLTPQIISASFDTAWVNTDYECHLQISDTSAYDTISWIAWTIPSGFQLDAGNGIVYGHPTSTGTFPCVIAVKNNGIITDVLQSSIPVIVPTGSKDLECRQKIYISPNPSEGLIVIHVEPNNLGYKYQIFAPNGKSIEEKIIYGSFDQFDYHNLARGAYLVRILNLETNNVVDQKLILY